MVNTGGEMTPQVRSLNYLRDRGWVAATVESLKRFPDKKVPACHTCGAQKMVMVRSDLFGFGDILAFNNTNVLIVQSTTKANMSTRWAKIRGLAEARAWVGCDGSIAPVERLLAVHGWWQKGRYWQLKEKLVSPSDFELTRMSEWDEGEEDQIPF